MKPTVICQNCDMGWIDFDLGRKMAKAETLKETDEVIAGASSLISLLAEHLLQYSP